LIFLLVVLLARQGRRMTLLVPSIEFALALDADLARYSVPTALLVGQSPDARRSHATRLAERIATLDSGGFGQTAAGAELLGTRCALSGFVSVPPPSFEFSHDRPPCTSVRQASLKQDGKEGRVGYRLCPLSTSCGRQRNTEGCDGISVISRQRAPHAGSLALPFFLALLYRPPAPRQASTTGDGALFCARVYADIHIAIDSKRWGRGYDR